MSDKDDDDAYARGQRDTKIATLEKDVAWLKKVILGIAGAVAIQWAKITGFWQ